MRTTVLPLSNIHLKPAFWGVDRNFEQVLENLEGSWHTDEASLHGFKETEHAYLMSMDMPGVNKNNLDIVSEDNNLVIKAKRKSLFDDEKKSDEYTHSIKIPKLADRDKIKAHCEDGVLYLALPKVEKAKPRKIEIGEGISDSNWKELLE